jgi:hypothetical protein
MKKPGDYAEPLGSQGFGRLLGRRRETGKTIPWKWAESSSYFPEIWGMRPDASKKKSRGVTAALGENV